MAQIQDQDLGEEGLEGAFPGNGGEEGLEDDSQGYTPLQTWEILPLNLLHPKPWPWHLIIPQKPSVELLP